MIRWIQRAWRVGRQARENVNAVAAAEAEYASGGTIREIATAYSSATQAGVDDGLDKGLERGLGEARQAVYNASQALLAAAASARALAGLAEGLAGQMDDLLTGLERLDREPLKDILEP